jgi:hypothetical protein
MNKKVLAILLSSVALSACFPEEPAPTPPTTWYVDADSDGFGDMNDAGTASTNKPIGYVSNNTDCNDANVGINAGVVGGTEVADLKDNSCDGVIDEGFKYIFASSAISSGNLGGLAGADNICQTLADASLLPSGTYKAWLSSSVSSAKDRLSHSSGPYVNYVGETLATDWANLVDGTLDNRIMYTELGENLGMANSNRTKFFSQTEADGSRFTGHKYLHGLDGNDRQYASWCKQLNYSNVE